MNHALSTHLFVNHRLTTTLLAKIQDAGIAAVEIFCARQHVDWQNRSAIRELGHWFREAQVKLWSMHAPIYTDEVWGRSGPEATVRITERTKAKRIQHVDEVKRVLDLAEIVPFRYLVQHLGAPGEEYTEWAEDAAFNSLEELSLFARQRGVEILLENIPNGFSSAEGLIRFLNRTHLELGLVLDTGHAHLNEGVERAFSLMKDRLRSTHVHDNDGEGDLHLFPKVADGGTIDWSRTMELLRSRSDQYPLLLELKEAEGVGYPLDDVKLVFERLEALAE